MYGYENKSGLLGSNCWFCFYSSINVGVTIFYQVSDVGFAYQSPPPYLTKAIS
jgi:hypothetical protein